MKLITPGKNQADWREMMTCKETREAGCGAVFEVGREDCFIGHSQRTAFAYCLCPCCGAEVGICAAKPFLVDLPSRADFKAAHPEESAKAEADYAASQAAYRANPPHDGMGRGY